MICLAIGLGVLGVAAMRHTLRCHHGAPGWRGAWYGRYHRHDLHRRHRWLLHATLARIDASPAQERAIIGQLDQLADRLHGARRDLRGARGDLAAAVRGPVLDDAALGAVLGRADASVADARAAMIDTLRAIHGLLDEHQRAQLADLVEHGHDRGCHGPSWRGHDRGWRTGPYR